ncbi:PTS sugar transporter subunit IIA [Candidatus Sumerlaeota bacterium]|nr:PTS sugar transporter subunit IIA [Candidatus Sumerlaeota bacterium]
MKLAHLLKEENILAQITPASKDELICRMAENAVGKLGGVTPKDVLEVVNKREGMVTSYIGHGVAMPHAKMPQMDKVTLCLASLEQGLEWDDEADQLVRVIFLVLGPTGQNSQMLQTLAALARLCSSKDNRDGLAQIKSSQRLLKLVEESGIDVKRTVTVADVMRDRFIQLTPEMTLREAVERMSVEEHDGYPVVNAQGGVVGSLCAADLLKIGVSPYIDLLTDDSFLTNFEPFEQFYEQENSTVVQEVMNKEVLVFTPSAPIIKVAHQMISHNHHRAFVVADNKLIGMIYAKDIMTKILNL